MTTPTNHVRRVATWPVYLLALPAAVSIWAGWVGLGGLTGFGEVNLLPGIWDGARIDTAITLPIGMEAYAAYALRVWLAPGVPRRAREFARASALAAFALGALGQIAFHLMQAAQMTAAPWPVTTIVACLPVGVLGLGASLAHLLNDGYDEQERQQIEARAAAEKIPTTPTPVPRAQPGGFGTELPPAGGGPRFQAVPNLTTTPARPTPAPGERSDPGAATQPDRAPAGLPDRTPAGRSESRPETTSAGRPGPDLPDRPASVSQAVAQARPAARRRGRTRGRSRTDAQLAAAVRELAARNGGAAPSQYQVRQALGVGGGRAARLVATYQPPTPGAPNGNGARTVEEVTR